MLLFYTVLDWCIRAHQFDAPKDTKIGWEMKRMHGQVQSDHIACLFGDTGYGWCLQIHFHQAYEDDIQWSFVDKSRELKKSQWWLLHRCQHWWQLSGVSGQEDGGHNQTQKPLCGTHYAIWWCHHKHGLGRLTAQSILISSGNLAGSLRKAQKVGLFFGSSSPVPKPLLKRPRLTNRDLQLWGWMCMCMGKETCTCSFHDFWEYRWPPQDV